MTGYNNFPITDMRKKGKHLTQYNGTLNIKGTHLPPIFYVELVPVAFDKISASESTYF